MSDDADIVALIRKQMVEGEAEMRRIVDMAMFKSDGPPLFGSVYLQPRPWWKRTWVSVRCYVLNVWEALRGRTWDGGDE